MPKDNIMVESQYQAKLLMEGAGMAEGTPEGFLHTY